MTMEDFFTLSEINNGLTATDRVKELVSVIQKEKDCPAKNISDATRQWSAVASSIAATENEDCLHHFIQLDGLLYLNKWLKDAEKFGNNSRDSFVEDSIVGLLRAIERLQAGIDKVIASGIWKTVKDLCGHNSSKVQDMAKVLFNSLNKEKENDVVLQGVQENGLSGDELRGITVDNVKVSEGSESCNGGINASQGSLTVEKKEETSKGDMLSVSSNSSNAEEIKNITPDNVIMNDKILHSTNSSSLSTPANENLQVNTGPPVHCPDGATSTEACSSADLKKGTQEGEKHAPELKSTDGVEKMQINRGSPTNLDEVEVPKSSLSMDDTDALKNETESRLLKNSNAKGKDSSSMVSSSDGLRTVESEAKSRMDDTLSPGNCRNGIVCIRKEGECNSDLLQGYKTSEHTLENFKNSGPFFQRLESDEPIEGDISDRSRGILPKDYDFSKPRMHRKGHAIEKKSDDLGYIVVDPLEFARLVANEVEREVEYSREGSSSSSEKELSSKVQQPESPDSVSGKQCQTAPHSPMEVATEPGATSEENQETEQMNGTQDAEYSQVTDGAQEIEANTKKGLSDFDLNEEVCSEDAERHGSIMSPPVSVVSASRAAAAHGMPVAPLQFEGTLGWKGSAATSAFRPASPRRAPDNDSSLSAGGSNCSSKQTRSFLNIDLNVAETVDDRVIDLQSANQIPVSSRLPSGESSVEVSQRISDRLELDLNRVSQNGDSPPDWKQEGHLIHQRNGHPSQSPSSSSSTKQPSLRNFDLNDQPTFANDSFSNYFSKSQNFSASGGLKSGDSVISIMGMKIEVNKKDSAVGSLPLLDGRNPEPSIDSNLARTGGLFAVGSPQYVHPHLYGYNGLAAGSTWPFPSSMYGPGGSIPYMVDPRGAPVVPQIMASSSALPPAFPQPPYVFSVSSAPSSNGVFPSQNNFNLNPGLILEGGHKELGGFRQLFNPAPARAIDEHLNANSQPSTSSGVGGKRKEPGSGWEPYPFKNHSQPWR